MKLAGYGPEAPLRGSIPFLSFQEIHSSPPCLLSSLIKRRPAHATINQWNKSYLSLAEQDGLWMKRRTERQASSPSTINLLIEEERCGSEVSERNGGAPRPSGSGMNENNWFYEIVEVNAALVWWGLRPAIIQKEKQINLFLFLWVDE